MKAVSELLSDVMEEIDARRSNGSTTRCRGIQTGLTRIDHLIDGLKSGRIHVVAGRPGIGVSTLIRSMVLGALNDGAATLFFTSGDDMRIEASRFLVAASRRKPIRYFENAQFSHEEWMRTKSDAQKLSKSKLFFDETDNISEIIISVSKFRLTHPMQKILVVLENAWWLKNVCTESRENIGRQLVRVAKELNIAIIVAARVFSRGGLNYYLKSSPLSKMTDIVEIQGVIESAEVVMTVEREEFYKIDTSEKGISWVNVIRNHQGPTGSDRLAFFGDISVVSNLDSNVKINCDFWE